MKPKEQRRFDHLYEQMLQDLVLQGLRPKTIEAYSRSMRRVAAAAASKNQALASLSSAETGSPPVLPPAFS